MNVNTRFWITVIASAAAFSQCTEIHAKQPIEVTEYNRQLRQEQKQEFKAQKQRQNAYFKACIKELRNQGRQLEPGAGTACLRGALEVD